jgi:hypothetical protein
VHRECGQQAVRSAQDGGSVSGVGRSLRRVGQLEQFVVLEISVLHRTLPFLI